MLKALLVILMTAMGATAWGQDPKLDSLSRIDREYMQEQRETVDDLARRYLGERLRGDATDLDVIQRLLDRQRVSRDDTQTLQALGIVLGDLLAKQEALDWVVYVDRRGRSRALQIPGTREVIFPVTMISRRYETGLEVDVEALYRRAREIAASVRHRNSPF